MQLRPPPRAAPSPYGLAWPPWERLVATVGSAWGRWPRQSTGGRREALEVVEDTDPIRPRRAPRGEHGPWWSRARARFARTTGPRAYLCRRQTSDPRAYLVSRPTLMHCITVVYVCNAPPRGGELARGDYQPEARDRLAGPARGAGPRRQVAVVSPEELTGEQPQVKGKGAWPREELGRLDRPERTSGSVEGNSTEAVRPAEEVDDPRSRPGSRSRPAREGRVYWRCPRDVPAPVAPQQVAPR